MKEFQNLTSSQQAILQHYLPEQKEIKDLSNYYYAFADSTRLKIIMCLCMTPMCVGDLSMLLKINQTTISHQLQILRNINIVKFERDRKVVTYSIINEGIEKMLESTIDAKNCI